ncbi:trypsin-like serine protease [Sorangium sp. So ce693]|uniref:trypsin-like serine protease n=1 Tax=Sorangium sp. So ce693 TaxID=3133318 RepID=UPI003F61295A
MTTIEKLVPGRLLAATAAVALAVSLRAAPARAITGNYKPDPVHTYVGLVEFYNQDGVPSFQCSGSLLSPRIFLTAGHCTNDAFNWSYARVYFHQFAATSFDPATQMDPVTGYPTGCVGDDPYCVTGHTLYDFGFVGFPGFIPNTHDAGIVVLDEPASFPTNFPSLAAPGTLDQLATRRGTQDTTFVASGYGVSDNWPPDRPVVWFGQRLMATTKLQNLRNVFTDGYNFQVSMSPGNDRGGLCIGDSGGPVLWDDSDIIAGLVSFGKHRQCLGNGFAFRVDQQELLDWILEIAATVGEDDLISVVPIPAG